MKYSKDNDDFYDIIKATVIDVDLDIFAVNDADEESIGEVVVLNFDNNNAPRKELILNKEEPSTWSGNVILSRTHGADKVGIFESDTGGTEIVFDGIDNKFANADLPKSLWVEGDNASSSMRDVTLTLKAEGTICEDKVTFTVLWVNISTDHSGSVEIDNAARDFHAATIVPPFSSYELGYHQFYNFPPFIPNTAWHGRDSEFIGNVQPIDFVPSQFISDVHGLHLAREVVSGNKFYGPNGDQLLSPTIPGPDTSSENSRDDDPQSGGSVGVIYDLDSPGLSIWNAPPNIILRSRVNFCFWAEWDPPGGLSPIRCSLKKNWYTRQSYKKTGSSDLGQVTSATVRTLTDNTKTWTEGIWAPGVIRILEGKGIGQVRRVTSNTTNSITVSDQWGNIPDSTSVYEVYNTSTWTLINDVAGDNVNSDGTTTITWNLQ